MKTAGLLQEKDMTIVGTVHTNVKEIPKKITKGVNEKFSSKFFDNDNKKCLLVNYQCKQKKNVNLISTMTPQFSTNKFNRKEETTCYFYNCNKVGVDVFD